MYLTQLKTFSIWHFMSQFFIYSSNDLTNNNVKENTIHHEPTLFLAKKYIIKHLLKPIFSLCAKELVLKLLVLWWASWLTTEQIIKDMSFKVIGHTVGLFSLWVEWDYFVPMTQEVVPFPINNWDSKRPSYGITTMNWVFPHTDF